MTNQIRYNLAKLNLQSLYTIANKTGGGDHLQIKSFKIRFGDIESIKTDFVDAYISLEASCKKDFDMELHQSSYNEFMEMYYAIKSIYEDLFPPQESKPSIETHHINLPNINLPKFSGKYTDYTNFMSLFKTLVHDNNSLNNIQRLHYLSSCLEGPALNVIKHLPITNENYEIAFSLIIERYDSIRLIADTHLENILLSTMTNLRDLRNFVNVVKENLQALSAMKLPVAQWDFILVHILTRKLSNDLRTKFELLESKNDLPSLANLITFLETQCKALENLTSSRIPQDRPKAKQAFHMNTVHKEINLNCLFCQASHHIYTCKKFRDLSVAERQKFIKANGICFSCLKSNHTSRQCPSTGACKRCGATSHNTLLHFESVHSEIKKSVTPDRGSQSLVRDTSTFDDSKAVLMSRDHSALNTVLLATAVVQIRDSHGSFHSARALLDSGSQATFISEDCVRRLRLGRAKVEVPVTALGGQTQGRTRGIVRLVIGSRYSLIKVTTSALVINKITNHLPSRSVPKGVVDRYKKLILADERFHMPSPIDILIGADIYNDVVNGDRLHYGNGRPSAIGTIFGYAIMGPMSNIHSAQPVTAQTSIVSFSTEVNLDILLGKLYEDESFPNRDILDPDNMEAELHFKNTTYRSELGRYVVRLPFRKNHPQLGDSYNHAVRRFYNLESRLQRDSVFKSEYSAFMNEYLNMGHMKLYDSVPPEGSHYYIPHHGVYKNTGSSRKIRVVFDASAHTSTGVSLNDCLMTGPKLQQDIIDIILNFRSHSVVLISDIKMMFRQILVDPDDQHYQLILWRKSPEDPLLTYALQTVTYGMKSSPYISMRVLHELAKLGEEEFPFAAKTLRSAIYVDDIITGTSFIPEAIQLQSELIALLRSGGFELRKWSSNRVELLENIPTEYCEISRPFDDTNFIKLLGIQWNPTSDTFSYSLNAANNETCTKRSILSSIARIYDPLGWLNPIIFKAKLIIQNLWLLHTPWDEIPPIDIVSEWNTFSSELENIQNISLNRRIIPDDVKEISLHGFCDASCKGYAASVYIRSVNMEGQVFVHLLIGKSRVAPVRTKLTIPKLELNGAVLLSRLMKVVLSSFSGSIPLDSIICWSDSSIVLSWLQTPPHLLQMYEGNRISQILNTQVNLVWRHVPSKLNAADPASRGLTPLELVTSDLWWQPPFLFHPPDKWPTQFVPKPIHELPGLRNPTVTNCHVASVDEIFLSRYSSLTRLQNVTAYCLRFYNNMKFPHNQFSGSLSLIEIRSALSRIIKYVQMQAFHEEIILLETKRSCPRHFQRLFPFLDSNGIVRVGGRLRHSDLSDDAKFPIVLPKSSLFTNLLIDHYHKVHCHAGPNALNAIIQQRYWIISARRVIRSRILKCLICFKLNAKPSTPQMADLPPDRVNISRPFEGVGSDFGGPFQIRASKLRNAKVLKAYLCLFVCLSTKAVHLELVSDLSTEGFLSAFSRFVSRRGLPSLIRTDCGSNYIGSNRHLNDVQRFLSKKDIQQRLTAYGNSQNIQWHFNAPGYPNAGGIFEAGIKVAKTLLKRIIGEQILTFEELTTVLTNIEAVMNSRPLVPLSSCPTEYNTLTPGHFLIGQPLVAVPEFSYQGQKMHLLSRYQLIQAIYQGFWARWQGEYLHTLQQRAKWLKATVPPQIGDLVLIKEDNLPPLQWRTGRIIRLLPGRDGIVRVVELRTPNGSLLRPMNKLCPFPKESD